MKHRLNTWMQSRVELLCAKLENSLLSDKSLKCKVVYGPVYSRKLGYVLGINNIRQKVCSYNCIYCPSGNSTCCSVCTNYCLSPYELHLSVKNKLKELAQKDKKIDYILFSGGGEPMLDSALSQEIMILREFGYKIAVFTNGSLLWNQRLQENLMFADYVSVKVDTVNETTWRKINHPHMRLDLDIILRGIKEFSARYQGEMTTDTMLIKNLNDTDLEIQELSDYLNSLKRKVSYFAAPVYPPAEDCAVSPGEDTLVHLSSLIRQKVKDSVFLCCPEKEEFSPTGDFKNELMGLLSVHPVSAQAIDSYISDKADKSAFERLIADRLIKETQYRGVKYYTGNATHSMHAVQ